MVVKMTVALEDELWKDFSMNILDKYGNRKKNDIFEALAYAFVNTPHKTIEEAIDLWIKEKEKKKQQKP